MALRRQGITATVDLTGAAPGTANYPVHLTPDWLDDLVVNRPLVTRITIETIRRKTLPVMLETVGRLRDDNLALAETPLQPLEVTIVGPRSEVERTVKAVATLELAEVDTNAPRESTLPVRLVDRDGNLLSGAVVTSVPSTVRATPLLSIAPGEKTVLVSPVFEGSPGAGFAAGGYRVNPPQVTLRGDASLLASVSKIFTEPIPVNGAREPFTVRVNLRVPAGTRVVEGRSRVMLRYLVRPAN